MSKLKGVFLDADSLALDSLDCAALEQLPVNLTCYPATQAQEVQGRIAEATFVLVNKVVLDATALKAAPSLKYIGVTATGMNNIDLDYCDAHDIKVQNVAGYGTDSVAQHTLMLLLNLATQFERYHKRVNQDGWSNSPHFCLLDFPITELAGKHAVILGHGELGKRVERLLLAFDMKVSIAARPGCEDDPRPSLASLLPSADVVTLHCPLTDDNKGIINEETLALMKPTCLLINTARGGLIDEAALLSALKNNQIGGAGLDVLSVEPPPKDHPLIQAELPNLLISPHNAWGANASRQRLLDMVVSHLKNFLTTQS